MWDKDRKRPCDCHRKHDDWQGHDWREHDWWENDWSGDDWEHDADHHKKCPVCGFDWKKPVKKSCQVKVFCCQPVHLSSCASLFRSKRRKHGCCGP